jgi:hypothetical protein
MMKSKNKHTRLGSFLATLAIILSFNGPALAIDDGARAYWKGRSGTQGVSFQYLHFNVNASDSQQFDPGAYIYPNSDVDANLFIATWAPHFTLFNRPSSFGLNIAGGSVDANFNTNLIPPQYLPPGVSPGSSFSQSASGFADPNAQLVVNLFGTPPLKSSVDLLNYEPTWTLDAAGLLALPIGQYDSDKLVNLGQNRWYGRIAFPFKYHFGVFDPGHMTSLEVTPSVWLFADNSDFLGKTLKNDPMWQLEAHLTHDFTRSFFGSLDLLYRRGFESEIDGISMGEDLNIGNLGFTLNYNATDNLAIRAGFSSNVFGDSDLDNSIIRIQFVYAWHQLMENKKKLKSGH